MTNGHEPYDVIALGETMLSLVASDGTLATANEFVATHGGAESNTLVALARSGARTAWVSRLGDDPAGERIRSALESEGVDLRWVRIDADRPTGLMMRDTRGGVRYWRSGSAASTLEPSDLDGAPIAEARAVITTGITAMLGPGPGAAALELLERARGLRAVDLNLRPRLWGSDRARDLVLPLVERCDVLFASASELATLIGGDPEGSARRCASLGPREVIVTRGATGAAALDPDGSWHEMRAEPVQEIDPVGAGDAFDAGYLAARLRGAPCVEALADAVAAGARTARALGDVGPPLGFEQVADA
ncbi:MAG: sugar kinase [Actinomycetota bacterium]